MRGLWKFCIEINGVSLLTIAESGGQESVRANHGLSNILCMAHGLELVDSFSDLSITPAGWTNLARLATDAVRQLELLLVIKHIPLHPDTPHPAFLNDIMQSLHLLPSARCPTLTGITHSLLNRGTIVTYLLGQPRTYGAMRDVPMTLQHIDIVEL